MSSERRENLSTSDEIQGALQHDSVSKDWEELEECVETAKGESFVPCQFICGCAGSGKTYSVRERIADDPSWGILTATTGIASVNLGDAVTLNSLLHFFDTDSLRDSHLSGALTRRLHELGKDYSRLVIDEVSMMDGDQLTLIYRSMKEANEYADVERPMGITLVADFCQLPPIRAKWAFESEVWPEFEAGTTRLTKMWRQEQLHFLDALNSARSGDGGLAAELLTQNGVEWNTSLDTDFDGTTIVPKNDQVGRFNQIVLDRVSGARFSVQSRRWGKQRGEWKNIPERDEFKVGAYVMILANSPCEEGRFSFVNGDCGHIESYDPDGGCFDIRLVRTGQVVSVPRIVRDMSQKDKPDGFGDARGVGQYLPRVHYWPQKKRYVLGQCEYYPIRLAYASTVHKSQGLSLDRIQVDIRDHFFSSPAMEYVALSRVRTLEGLRIVGQRERFVKNCRTDSKVTRWL